MTSAMSDDRPETINSVLLKRFLSDVIALRDHMRSEFQFHSVSLRCSSDFRPALIDFPEWLIISAKAEVYGTNLVFDQDECVRVPFNEKIMVFPGFGGRFRKTGLAV